MDRVIIMFAVLCCGVQSLPALDNPRVNLTRHLFKDYDPGVIPIANADANLTVLYDFVLGRVDNLNWDDPFLSWDPEDFGGVESLVIPAKRVWIPEIVLKNGVEEGKDLALDSEFRIRISYTGDVVWIPSFRWPTTCNVDLTLFPLDSQLCNVSFMAWLESMDGSMYFQSIGSLNDQENPTVLTGLLTANEQWAIVESRVSDFVGSLDTGNGQGTIIASLSFSLLLRRQPIYYIVNILVPCLTISLVSMFMFYLPIESGEKVSFGITVLLSYTLLLLMINDITPKGGPNVPMLTYYIIFSMTLSALALICTFFILRVHNRPPDTPVPQWVRRIFLCHCTQAVHTIHQAGHEHEDDLKALKKPAFDETVVKKQWEKVARRLDRIAFVFFLSTYAVISGIMATYIITCSNDSEFCQHVYK